MNLFDGIQKTMFSTVSNVIGYAATWMPAEGGQVQPAQVLYNGPTEKEKLLSAEYDPENIYMEYQCGSFPGLFEAAKGNSTQEVVSIETLGDFFVKSIRKEWDGKSFKAYLKIKV